MQIISDAFDKDMVMFDASSSLSYMRSTTPKDNLYAIIQTNDEIELMSFYPRLYTELRKYITGKQKYMLYFFRTQRRDMDKWEDLIINGPASIFIISSKFEASLKPGTLIKLEDEEYTLQYKDFVNHFVGIAYD